MGDVCVTWVCPVCMKQNTSPILGKEYQWHCQNPECHGKLEGFEQRKVK